MPSAIVYRHVRSFIALLTFAGSLLLATSAIAAHPLPATPSGAVAPPGPPPPVLGACAAPRWLVGRVEATSATSLTSFTSLTAPTTPPTFMASRPVAGGLQVTVPRGTDSTVEVRPLGADTIELVARWNALLLRQTVRRDGRMTLELRVGRQRTLVVVTPDSVRVSATARAFASIPAGPVRRTTRGSSSCSPRQHPCACSAATALASRRRATRARPWSDC